MTSLGPGAKENLVPIPLNLPVSEIMMKRKGGDRMIVRTTLKAGGVLFAE